MKSASKAYALKQCESARLEWAEALMDLSEEDAIVEIKQMMCDAMDSREQSGIDAALVKAHRAFTDACLSGVLSPQSSCGDVE